MRKLCYDKKFNKLRKFKGAGYVWIAGKVQWKRRNSIECKTRGFSIAENFIRFAFVDPAFLRHILIGSVAIPTPSRLSNNTPCLSLLYFDGKIGWKAFGRGIHER